MTAPSALAPSAPAARSSASIVYERDGYRILHSSEFGLDPFLMQTDTGRGHWQSLSTHATQGLAEKAIVAWQGHREEKSGRNRPVTRPNGMASPWGLVQTMTTYAPGIVSVTTAEHGGFLLDPEHNDRVPEALRTLDGAYEEDQAWSAVAFAYPEVFTTFERREADQNIREHQPDVYTRLTGHHLAPEESRTLRLREFLTTYGDRYLACSTKRIDNTHLAVSAAIGGRWSRPDGSLPPMKTFRVESQEYDPKTEFSFVIDPERHPEIHD